jgi:hypothetical protein
MTQLDRKLDKEKYYRILKSEGLSAAITQLHRDSNELEFELFEGAKGYQPDLWEYMKEVRRFSVELWNSQLADPKLN